MANDVSLGECSSDDYTGGDNEDNDDEDKGGNENDGDDYDASPQR